MLGKEKRNLGSSDVELKRLELATDGAAPGTSCRSASRVLADEHVDAVLAEAAYAFGTRITFF